MKALIGLFVITLSINSFAKDCYKTVEDYFLKQTPDYVEHAVSERFETYAAGTEGFESYGRFVELGYDFDVIAYHASNEMWGGYGAYQIIVEPKTCKVLKMKEVYAE